MTLNLLSRDVIEYVTNR